MRPSSRRILLIVLFSSAFATALAFRLPRLAERPMHADEAVQAVRFRQLRWEEGYKYDPNEFHGPTLSYATLPSAGLDSAGDFAQTDEATYRRVTVVFGLTTILLLLLLYDALGREAMPAAALLLAVSPAVVFYSRYYIHETLLACFTLGAIGAFWRWRRTGRLDWMIAAGACLGLMQATKETAVLSYAAAAGAVFCSWIWRLALREPVLSLKPPTKIQFGHVAWGLVTALLTAVVLYSSFFANPRGPLDALLAYLPWLGRAAGDAPHIHPWYFYLQRLAWWHPERGPVWSEGLILLLAAVGGVASLVGRTSILGHARREFVRWLVFYTLLLTGLYCVIPYKTPWCLLQFLLPMILLAGVGTAVLIRLMPTLWLKLLLGLILLTACGQLGWQSYRTNFLLSADRGNPYVYAHTSPGVLQLADLVEQLIEAAPAGAETPIQVVWTDAYYWPIPWYFRGYGHVELWTSLPPAVDAPVVVASPRYDAALIERLDTTHLMIGYYEIRPNVLAEVWARMDVWEAHLRRLGRIE